MNLKEQMEARVAELNSALPALRHNALTAYLAWQQLYAAEEAATNERDSLLEILEDMGQPPA